MNTQHTRDLDPNYYINAKGELVPIPIDELAAKILFKEHLHPRDLDGRFIKGAKKPRKFRGSFKVTDIRSKIEVEGDSGFEDILVGLAAGAINEVMDIPANMHKIVLRENNGLIFSGAAGAYDPDNKEINLISAMGGRALTAIHEIGHFLDMNWSKNTKFLGYKDDGSEMTKGALNNDAKLRSVINNSAAMKKLNKMKKDPSQDARQMEYLTRPTEVFARAFMQYTVSRSSNKTLKKEFAEERKYNADELWSDKDFEPIGREFDRLFKTKKRKK